jgi:formylglycine-generating enzyme required for sulfatase activity
VTLVRVLLNTEEDWSFAQWHGEEWIELRHGPTGMDFVLLPTGEFQMGSAPDVGIESERPRHTVHVPAFLMAKRPCTQQAWDRIGGDDFRHWNGHDLPIEGVSWESVRSWCAKAGLELPSEARWEYACRAGSPGRWCFGDDEARLGEFAWYDGNSGGRPHPVGELAGNGFGLHDVHGNVWEWCDDRSHPDFEGAPEDASVWVDEGAPFRVLRGGSWNYSAEHSRSAYRSGALPTSQNDDTGFRPALTLPLND